MSDSESDDYDVGTDEGKVRACIWASQKKLFVSAAKILLRLGFTSMEALVCIKETDLERSDLPIGQIRLVMKSVGQTFMATETVNTRQDRAGVSDPSPVDDVWTTR
ncbi:hypothetical protein KP79_PYT05941 [Mizuhopecten yessoensis]|uniref:Uncharacterized protein n=1 Tax=Mizuhopecten yessoensis TaxID=6573 RepID=A0A210QA74_MIZYE|nr:hypothetical protein KP79_PYT05941 [Mizuhopecten yessoensis]